MRGRHEEAFELFTRVAVALEKTLGPHHIDTLTVKEVSHLCLYIVSESCMAVCKHMLCVIAHYGCAIVCIKSASRCCSLLTLHRSIVHGCNCVSYTHSCGCLP
jgi:hypothetical protein